MERLLPVMAFFSQNPLVIFLVALVFIAPCFFPVYTGRQKSLLLPCSICWLMFGLWTFYMLGRNIDLVKSLNPVLFLVLLTVGGVGIIIVIQGLIRKPASRCSIE